MSGAYEAIKTAVPILKAVEMYGVKVDQHGKGLCPFHKEKTPSFNINADKGLFKCFGCGVGGDVITLTAMLFGLRNGDAAKKLDADFRLGLLNKRLTAAQRAEIKAKEAADNKRRRLREGLAAWREKRLNELYSEYWRLDGIERSLMPPETPPDWGEWAVANPVKFRSLTAAAALTAKALYDVERFEELAGLDLIEAYKSEIHKIHKE